MSNKSGRPKTHKFNSEDFKKLSTEERRLRGRISTLRRMIKKRESDIEELMKPILKKRKEIKKIQTELSEITEVFNTSNYNFPKFRVEGYTIVKGKDENGNDKYHSYYRGVWYVNSKKKQMYLGSEKSVWEKVKTKFPNSYKKDESILDFFLNELQMKFWNDEYEDFKK
jgi:seryl-tRNA synthetase